MFIGPPDKKVQIIIRRTRALFFRSPLKKTDQMGAPYKERHVPDNEPKKTMLGEQQWDWLEEQMNVPLTVDNLIQIIADGHGGIFLASCQMKGKSYIN